MAQSRQTHLRTTRADDGMAVAVSLLAMALLLAVAIGLVALADEDRVLGANYRGGVETLYAADAAAERALLDLRPLETWDAVLAGIQASTFSESPPPLWPAAHLAASIQDLTAQLQHETNVAFGSRPDTPSWQLFLHGSFASLVGDAPEAWPYLIAWVADDVADGDGDPKRDANGVVLLRAGAWGYRGARRVVEMVLARSERYGLRPPMVSGPEGPAETAVRVQSWREVQ